MAQDGEEVLTCLSSNDPSVSAVVLDMVMPRRDGINALRGNPPVPTRHLPVIMMSGAASTSNVADAMKSGANDFIPKPIKPDDLRRS